MARERELIGPSVQDCHVPIEGAALQVRNGQIGTGRRASGARCSRNLASDRDHGHDRNRDGGAYEYEHQRHGQWWIASCVGCRCGMVCVLSSV